MRPLKHGYTNRTLGDGAVVKKTYEGPDAELRLDRERTLLTRLQGQLPVPPVHTADADTLTLGFMPGAPGQELLDAGHAVEVLEACGKLLRRIHGVSVHDEGRVLVHGDYGPNNVLLDPVTFQITAVVDWEFAHLGDPVEDLAWCEWIVRMHHPEHRRALDGFFRAYGGDMPPWPARQGAMLARCESLQQFCHRWEPNAPGVTLWRERAVATAGWEEWPRKRVSGVDRREPGRPARQVRQRRRRRHMARSGSMSTMSRTLSPSTRSADSGPRPRV